MDNLAVKALKIFHNWDIGPIWQQFSLHNHLILYSLAFEAIILQKIPLPEEGEDFYSIGRRNH